MLLGKLLSAFEFKKNPASLAWCLLRAKLSYHCKAPENHSLPAYLSDAVVTEMQNGWNLNKIKTGNKETLKGINVKFCEAFFWGGGVIV